MAEMQDPLSFGDLKTAVKNTVDRGRDSTLDDTIVGQAINGAEQYICAELGGHARFLEDTIEVGHGGVDIGPLKSQNIPLIGLQPDTQRYFDFHHTDNDVFENVHKRELELGCASVASLIYLIDTYGL